MYLVMAPLQVDASRLRPGTYSGAENHTFGRLVSLLIVLDHLPVLNKNGTRHFMCEFSKFLTILLIYNDIDRTQKVGKSWS